MNSSAPVLMQCTRCVLAEHPPDVLIDEAGVCNHCRTAAANRGKSRRTKPLLETDLGKILKKHRGRGKYDCLVMCSGGKDSTAALYYMVKRYHLRPLVFTFDHGLGCNEGLENAERAADILGVDFLYSRSTHMHELFAEIIRSRAPVPICPPCSLWYMQHTFDLARRFGISLIVTGWTRGQMDLEQAGGRGAEMPGFPSLSQATTAFMKRMRCGSKYKDLPRTMQELARRNKKLMIISPHWFIDRDAESYARIITDELGWQPPGDSYPRGSTNCKLNFISVYISMRDYGFSHYHIEMSQMVRQGVLSREEALAALEMDLEREPVRSIITESLERLGCSWEQLRGSARA